MADGCGSLRTPKRWAGALVLALASGSAGWMLRGPSDVSREQALAPPASPAGLQAASGLSVLTYPRMVEPDELKLHADGSVSLRVEKRAPAWVLAEMCRHGARLPACAGAATGAEGVAPAGLSAAPRPPWPEHAGEQVRLQRLQEARLSGAPVPEAALLQLMRSDPSEQVRLEALDQLVDLNAGSPEALRAALRAALYVPNTVLQARAREHLDQLDEVEQQEAAAQQPGS